MINEVLKEPCDEWCSNCDHEVKVYTTGGKCPICGAPLPACSMCDVKNEGKCVRGSNFNYHENCNFIRQDDALYTVWCGGKGKDCLSYSLAVSLAKEYIDDGYDVAIELIENGSEPYANL